MFVIIFATAFILWLTYMYMTWPYGYFKKHGIPGPKPVPMFGNWNELGKKHIYQIDEEFIAKYGKIVGNYNGWLPELIISDLDLIKQFAIKEFNHFIDRRDLTLRGILKHSVLDARGNDWKRIRSLFSPFFSTGKLRLNSKRITTVLNNVTKQLETYCESGEEIEGKEFASCITMDVICSVGFGVEVESFKQDNHPLVQGFKQVIQDFWCPSNKWFLVTFLFPGVAKILDDLNVSMFRSSAFTTVTDVTRSLIKQKQEGHTEAQEFVTSLVKAHEDALAYETETEKLTGKPSTYKGMTEDEIVANGIIFLGGGFDTTATTLGFMLYLLATNEECQVKLYEEINTAVGKEEPTYDNIQPLSYLDCCVNETLRLYPPGVRFDRKCVKATKLGDLSIPKGMLVTVPVWHLHHDPDVWPDPYKFDPLRFSPEVKTNRHPFYFMPFGIGPRQCPGLRLALMEIKMTIVKILQNFQLVKNNKTVPVVMKEDNIFPDAKDGLWFSVQKRED